MVKKRVFSFVPYHWSPHLEADLEIINSHVVAGDEVTVFVCEGELPACAANAVHDLEVCKHCISKRRNTFNVSSIIENVKVRNFVNLTESDARILEKFKNKRIASLTELKAICLENCMIGNSIYSELMTSKMEIEPNLEENSNYVTNSIEASALTYLSFKNHFEKSTPDIFYSFNNRFVVNHAAIQAAKALGVPFAIHDRAGTLNRYLTVPDTSLHSLDHWKDQIKLTWEQSQESLADRETTAKVWFESRLRNENQEWYSFTEGQDVELPPQFDKGKLNLVIFNSSDFELKAFEDYKLPFYEDQNAAILEIVESLQDRPDIHVYLRVHPHLKGLQNSQTRFIQTWLVDKFSNLTVIEAESKIKTYGLMMNADVVLTFGSTTGVEAAYFGVPSILAGHSWYEDLEVSFRPNSHRELIELLRSKAFTLSENEKTARHLNAVKYGYFVQTNGRPFTLFEQNDVMSIKIKATGKPVAYDPVSFPDGLKRELSSRAELSQSPYTQPLASLVRELESVCERQFAKNTALKSTVKELQNEVERLRSAAIKEHRDLQAEICNLKSQVSALETEKISAKEHLEPAHHRSLHQIAKSKIARWMDSF